MLTRRAFLGAGVAAALPAAPSPRPKPNFLVILADDMGYSDAGCYGGEIATPHLDRLAAGGLRFTQGYSTARCGPSRSSLLTGYYAQQTASDVMTPGNVPRWTTFLPQALKPLGYRSYHSGKWHIRFRPVAGTGFDHSYCLQDQDRFFTPRNHLLDDEPLPAVKESDGYYATEAIGDYARKWLRAHAREHRGDPFFLYLAFTAPHFPLHARQGDIAQYRDQFAAGWDVIRRQRWKRMREMGLVRCALAPLEPGRRPAWNLADEKLLESMGPGEAGRAVPWASLTAEQQRFQRTKMAIHAAMITSMDREIGGVLNQLEAMDALRDTVIVFLSDNGASAELIIRADGHDRGALPGSASSHLCLGPGWSSAANTPFRLHKSWVHEGGIASPWIVHWPAGLRDAGKLRHAPCHFVDVLPTLVELAGGDPARAPDGAPPVSGRSLVPAFARDGAPHEFLYFHHLKNRALREGDWKLVSAGYEPSAWELYDLRRDRSELRNLAAADPQRVQAMAARWQQLDAEFIRQRESAAPSQAPRL